MTNALTGTKSKTPKDSGSSSSKLTLSCKWSISDPFLADKFAFYSTLRHVNEQRFCCFCFFSNQGNQVPNEQNIAVRSSRKQPTENPA